jgi:hypothetical protein
MTFDSIYDEGIQRSLKQRLDALAPDTRARWGRMSAHQAVVHLADAFRLVFGERPTAYKGGLVLKIVSRVYALSLPAPWPKGVETAPEVDQERGGTTPTEFASDMKGLVALTDRFIEMDGRSMAEHPIFGSLTRGEWGRWGYRHLDHHLRQFGV